PDPAPDVERAAIGWVLGAFFVFVASGIVLVAEIVAMRVIAPYVGITLETTSAVIGCVLAGISLGSWLGGWLADRLPMRALLAAALALGGAALGAAPYIVHQVGPHLTPSNPSSAVLLTAIVFLTPSIALSAVTPTVIKGLGQGSRRLGSVAGAISAIATAGALIGNFGAGFVLVGNIRASQILVLCGAVCLAVAAVPIFALGEKPWRLRPGRVVVTALLLTAAIATSASARQLPCDVETKYVCLNIETIAPGKFLFRSNIAEQSITNALNPKDLTASYVQAVATLVGAAHPASPRGLAFGYVGGGGFTLPLFFEARYPGSSHVVYEIDQNMVDRVAAVLGINHLEQRFPTRIGDARTTILSAPRKSMDVIVGDAFSGLSVPWQITTKEFLEDVHERLKDDGIYVMNLVDADRFDLARAEARTFRTVFPEVAVGVPIPVWRGDGRAPSNILLIGGAHLPDSATPNFMLGQMFTTVVLEGTALDKFIGNAPLLTDDFAPVDQLIGNTYRTTG
ncbi:MAG TPA: fused MFS/spermidine synthase, partial [Acidimicrobiia bacterium]|nr:fused MFS/spermidine synthase [Acidimicrobiia bacterium]